MEYINHIGKYTDGQAVADALDAGTLASPYVVEIDGSIYYDNYPEPDACADWEGGGYESYEDCRCQQYGEDCPEEVDCSDWENLGYESEDDCNCQNFGYDTNGDPCGEPEEEGGEEEPEEE